MTKQFQCQMCDATLTGRTTDEVVEKIKQHGKEQHDIQEMSADELEKRKNRIEDV